MFRYWVLLMCGLLSADLWAQVGTVAGRVVGPDGPVPFASTLIKGTTVGMATDGEGRFELREVPSGPQVLLISVVGFAPIERELSVRAGQELRLGDVRVERSTADLEEVVITGTLREVTRSESPVPIEVVTTRLFRKNPSPVLFDAVSMINGVRSQLNCSVCNTGDIHINGMEGPYTMVLIDGMPIVSALSTVYGLSGIPISMIDRVEVMKGPGSSLYGSEAMGGIINVITKDPAFAPRASVDMMATNWQELNLDMGARIGKGRVNDLIGVNLFRYGDPRDENGDGFTDLTLQERISVFNKIALARPGKKLASLAGRLVSEDRWGGQMAWSPAYAGTDSVYGEAIKTRRWELIGQYQLPVRERIVLQVSANGHRQRSWYGTTPYDADQHVLFGQLVWSKRIEARHDLLAGFAYRRTTYNDNTPATSLFNADGAFVRDRPERRPLPGLFVQDEWSINEHHKLLVGMRADRDMDHGLVHSPRLAYKWSPGPRWTVRANFGTGFRVVNLFAEDHAALTGARTVVITEALRPERSLNGAINIVKKWPGEKRAFGLDGTLFYTYFSDRILPDYHSDPDLIIYTNLDGHAVSRGVSLTADARLAAPLRISAGATFMEVFTTQQAQRSDVYFAPRWSGTFAVSYDLSLRWSTDLTGQVYGPMRLPVLPNDFRPEYGPTHALLNMQLKYRAGNALELYGGVKNLLDFVPKDPIIRPFDPFDRTVNDPISNPNGYTFDPTYIYAPLQGIRGFIGLRWTLS